MMMTVQFVGCYLFLGHPYIDFFRFSRISDSFVTWGSLMFFSEEASALADKTLEGGGCGKQKMAADWGLHCVQQAA